MKTFSANLNSNRMTNEPKSSNTRMELIELIDGGFLETDQNIKNHFLTSMSECSDILLMWKKEKKLKEQ